MMIGARRHLLEQLHWVDRGSHLQLDLPANHYLVRFADLHFLEQIEQVVHIVRTLRYQFTALDRWK
ncbi:hypothetical protein D3C84_1090640 [compost metagenome]